MLNNKNYVEVYIWKKSEKTDKGHISLQLFIDGVANPENYLSFFPLINHDKENHIKSVMKEEKVLMRVHNGCFFYPCADNYYYNINANGVLARKNCEIRRVYSLNINKIKEKIRELKAQPPIFNIYIGSALLTLENHRNCAGIISEALHAGGIRKLFVLDQLLRACVSGILSFSAIYMLFTKIDFYYAPPSPIRRYEDFSTKFLMTAMLPATMLSRLISCFYPMHEFDCLLFGISLSSALSELNTSIINLGIILELFQANIASDRRSKLIQRALMTMIRPLFSILPTTAVIKYIPTLFNESSVTTMNSFFLGNIFGKLIDSYVHYCFDDDASMFGYVALIDQLTVFTLVAVSGLGQLIPDGLALMMSEFLARYGKYLPDNISLNLNVFHDKLTRFSWLVERPNDLSTLLYNVEKLETEDQQSSSILTTSNSGFFNKSAANFSLYIRSFFSNR